jgi:hypothetical protein
MVLYDCNLKSEIPDQNRPSIIAPHSASDSPMKGDVKDNILPPRGRELFGISDIQPNHAEKIMLPRITNLQRFSSIHDHLKLFFVNRPMDYTT